MGHYICPIFMYYINVRLASLRSSDQTSATSHFSTGFSTMPELTTEQWDQLIEQYVEIVVDGMDWKTMNRFVTDVITQDMKELESRQDLLDEIRYSFDEEFLDELLDNVTTDIKPVDPKTYTYGLEPGESISFPVHSPTE